MKLEKCNYIVCEKGYKDDVIHIE